MVALQHFLLFWISLTSSSRWLGVTERLMRASTYTRSAGRLSVTRCSR